MIQRLTSATVRGEQLAQPRLLLRLLLARQAPRFNPHLGRRLHQDVRVRLPRYDPRNSGGVERPEAALARRHRNVRGGAEGGRRLLWRRIALRNLADGVDLGVHVAFLKSIRGESIENDKDRAC